MILRSRIEISEQYRELVYARMRLPEEYRTHTVESVHSSVRPAFQDFMNKLPQYASKGKGLAILGPEGTGKTTLAAILARYVRVHRCSVLFTRAWELQKFVHGRVPFDNDESFFERLYSVDFLVVDDLLSLSKDAFMWSYQDIYQLARGRRSRLLPTCFTATTAPEEFYASEFVTLSRLAKVLWTSEPNYYELED